MATATRKRGQADRDEWSPTMEEMAGDAPVTCGRLAKIAMRLVPVGQIVVDERARELREDQAVKLADQMREAGRLLQPIGVTSDLHLVWGRHRLRAAQILGWREIPAAVQAYAAAAPQRTIDEIDENLARTELTALEISQAFARRKAVWLQLHPETGRGRNGGRPQKEASATVVYQRPDGSVVEVFRALGDRESWLVGTKTVNGHHRIKSPKLRAERSRERAQYSLDRYAGEKHWVAIASAPFGEDACAKLTDTVAVSLAQKETQRHKSFTADAAEKTGKSERTVRRATAIGEGLPDEVVKVVKGTPLEDQPSELAALARRARKGDPEAVADAAAAARCVLAGEAKNVRQALEPPEPEAPESDQVGEAFKTAVVLAVDAWTRKHKAAATAQLAAAVLYELADEWSTQTWTGGAEKRRKPR